jgi:Zn-dependent alcohol dehydrogenase
MKTFFLSLIAVIGLSTVSYAQDASNSATAQTKTQLASAKEIGVYTFVMPAALTAEEVSKNSKYYVHYFTTEFNASTKEVKLKMNANDELGRKVITRFLASCGVQNVIVEGKSMITEDFFNTYMK